MTIWEEYKQLFRNKPVSKAKKEFEMFKLFPITLDSLKQSSLEVFKDYKPKGIIITIGLSPEPIAGTLAIINPDRACLIHTKESERIIDEVLSLSRYSPAKIKKYLVDKDSPISLYDNIRLALKELIDEHISEELIAIDPTGGTKIMPFIAGLLSQNFNLNLIYVSNKEFDDEFRRPVPGSEYFILQQNLVKTFNDGIFNLMLELLRQESFVSSTQLFEKYTNETNKLNVFIKYLLQGLVSWDSFNYKLAMDQMNEALRLLDEFKPERTQELKRIIVEWINYLTNVEQDNFYQAIDTFGRASRLFKISSYNDAATLYYMALEKIIEHICYLLGLDRNNPNYKNLNTQEKVKLVYKEKLEKINNEEKILTEWTKVNIFKKVKKKDEEKKLPTQLGLFEGLLFISIVEEKITREIKGKILSLSTERNNMIHRLIPVNWEKVKKFDDVVKEVIQIMLERFFSEPEYQNLIKIIDQNPIRHEYIEKIIEWIKYMNLQYKKQD